MFATVCLIFCVLLGFVDSTKNTGLAFSSSSTTVNALVGEEVRLLCRVKGQSKPEYWWEKNGNRLPKSKKYRIKKFRYLRIKAVEKSDAGDYVCWASNGDSKINQTITLNDKENTELAFSSYSTNVDASVGEKAWLLCRVNDPRKTEYWWEKNGNRLRRSGRYQLKKFRYLIIKAVEKPDAGDYVCWASNGDSKINQTITLNVKDPHSGHFTGENTGLAFSSYSTNVDVSVGEEAWLPCRVNGPRKTEYWWEKNGNRLRNSKRYRPRRFRILKIKAVEKSDAGDYVCWASNGDSKINQTITLNVKVSDIKPYFTEKQKMKKDYLLFPAGNKLKIVCSANGRPQPSVIWYKDNKELKYMPDGVTPLTNTTFEITFEWLKPKHAGRYKCRVSNKAGVIQKTYNVKVKEMMVVKPILQNIKNITAYEGDNVTITCKAVSDGLPNFQWVIKQNNTFKVLDPGLSADEYIWKSDSDRWHGVNLRLVNVTQKDERGYYCIVGDDRGYDYQTFQLNVIPRPIFLEDID